MKIAVYTSMIGNFDKIPPLPEQFRDEADYYIFSDQDIKDTGYKLIKIKPEMKNNRRQSRIYKLNPHIYLPQYKYTIYLDSCIELLASPKILVKKYLKGYDIAAHDHPWRDCIYNEAEACLRVGFIGEKNKKRQVEFLRKEGYPEHNGLFENGVLIRRNNEKMKELSELWYSIYNEYTQRDQLSFCYCLWKLGIKCNTIQNDLRFGNSTEFKYKGHLK